MAEKTENRSTSQMQKLNSTCISLTSRNIKLYLVLCVPSVLSFRSIVNRNFKPAELIIDFTPKKLHYGLMNRIVATRGTSHGHGQIMELSLVFVSLPIMKLVEKH
ncbi:hypothetical protein Lal_00032262 [Lupinus albus]|nr:hypothetical protein Lal_00032262 [Lupinus albus]